MSLSQTSLAIQPSRQRPVHEGEHHLTETDTETHRSDSVSIEDSVLFASLFAVTGAESSGADESEPLYRPAHHSQAHEPLILNAAVQQIAGHIQENSQDMECMLLLPHLGEVRMQATQQDHTWHINLTFMRPAALAYAKRSQTTIHKRLSESLESPVVLGLFLREEEESDDASNA
ncbi:hypothetical protein [Vibrio mangrovi]|uniref:Flagellar hook-length control protein FliK n=1 Tax=Vibrio mangrovi TaxID=474394 RepID=A0A1Y6IXY7_9VIBR|nr:hypothetical protein [Vibrio mangrovi]MDW6001966.1 hypothetical protein [Vibrio mangrovi]SMS02486.1 hypothetical protein VIM7927_03819 [Vibrio mangrovi]